MTQLSQPSAPSRPPLSHHRAIALALLVTALWSSSWVLLRIGMDDEGLRPITFAGIRYALASLLLTAVVLRSGARTALRTLDRYKVRTLVVLGLVWFGVTQGAQYVAIDNQPATTTTLVFSMTPLLVALMSARLTGEAPTTTQLTATVVALCGAAVYFMGELGATRVGMAAAIIGLVANATGALMGRNVNRDSGIPPSVVTAVSMVAGAAALLVVGVAVEGVPQLSAKAWLIVSWLAIVNSALAFTLWNRAQQILQATESAIINNAMLPQIALLAWVFLGEPIGPKEAAGIALILGALYLAQRNAARVP